MLNIAKLSEIKITRPKFLIKDFLPIPENGVTMISSRGGYGKTFLAIRIALEVAKNYPDKKILLWLTEDPEGVVKNRAKALVRDFMPGYEFEEFEQAIDIVTNPPIQLAYKEKGIFKPNPDWANLIDDLIDYDVIVFDPLLAFFGGEENDNSQARIFMQPFIELATRGEKSIILLHHSTKPNKDGISKTRGAGAFTDACRLVYELELPDNSFNLKHRKVKLIKDNWGVVHFFGREKEIMVLPDNVSFEEEKPGEVGQLRISISTHEAYDYQPKMVTMDKLCDVVKSKYFYSATLYKNNHRRIENALPGQDLIILDFDDGMEIEDAKQIFGVYDCIIATTKSHQKPKNGITSDRFRVILRVDYPIELNPQEYSKLLEEIIRTYGADKACKDISRKWSPYREAEVFRFKGKPFDWRRFYKKVNIKQLKKSFRPETEHNQDKLVKAIKTLFDNEYTPGNRNNTVVRALKWLKDEGFAPADIRTILSNEIDVRGGLGDGEREKETIFRTHLRSV